MVVTVHREFPDLFFSSNFTGASVVAPVSEVGDFQVYFCPRDNCSSHLLETISLTKDSVYCAFFDLDLENIISELSLLSETKDVKVVIDNNNYDAFPFPFVQDTSSQYSHNKFCIIDKQIVTTGSMNPTVNGDTKNSNNLVIINSSLLAKNYLLEFDELWNLQFGKGDQNINSNFIIDNISVENYFCPEDWCVNKILEQLHSAKHEVRFMIFSFTSDAVGRKLVELNSHNISVEGVLESQQNSKYSEYSYLLNNSVDVLWDKEKGKLHHKVFIIDGETVITGSMNPSKSGDTKNDENMLIIHDKEIASLFLQEYDLIRARAES